MPRSTDCAALEVFVRDFERNTGLRLTKVKLGLVRSDPNLPEIMRSVYGRGPANLYPK